MPVTLIAWCTACGLVTDYAGYDTLARWMFAALGLRMLVPRWWAAFMRR